MLREPSFYILLAVIAFIAGVAYRSFFPLGAGAWWALAALALAAAGASAAYRVLEGRTLFALRVSTWSAAAVVVILSFLLGAWRFDEAYTPTDPLASVRDTGEEVKLTGIVAAEPQPAAQGWEYEFRTRTGDGILLYGPRSPVYEYGDELLVRGELVTPEIFDGFNYRDFLKKEGILSIAYSPSIEKTGEGRGNPVYAGLLNIKSGLREALYTAVSPPYADVLAAMTLGDRFALSDDLGALFSRAGIRHIVAISGMHIAIIAGILITLALGSGLRLRHAFWAVGLTLIVYIAMIGAPASAVRAGIMAAILLAGRALGREYVSVRALVIAAFLMLLLNPLLLRFDAGFQLSFLAIMGIIFISPIFERWFMSIPVLREGKAKMLRAVIAMTLSAQLATLPLVTHNFGVVSLAAPLVNILIVPVVPFVLGIGFAGVLLGSVSGALGTILLYPAYLLVVYIVGIARVFDGLPWSSVTEAALPWWAVVAAYVILIGAILYTRRRLGIAGEGEGSIDRLVGK